MVQFMAGVMCPRCGTVSPTEAQACPKCGTSLPASGDATGRSARALKGSRPPMRRAATDASMAPTALDDTMMEDEPPRPAAPRRPATPSRGPVPQNAPAPRRSTGGRPALGDSAASSSSAGRDSLIGRSLQDYVIQEKLGVGGMGVVYKATHQLIGKAVAVKVLRADIVQDPRDMDRLLDEARIISSIKNRGIINIFGAGTLEDGRHYLIMELLEGESLEEYMQREGKVPAGDAIVILEQVLSALTAAHEAGVVHRDLKPANVFLVREGQLVYTKLLDFGLARRKQENVTRIAGTPDYISPEHARGRPAGPPADLYAFGVLCFHMLTGQLPFVGNTPMEVMEKHVHSPPPVPHEVNKAIPKALSELILKLLAKEPAERPDATQVKADLKAATKQMRTATTMMSMAAIEPVVSTKEEVEDQERRAKELARDAQVADLKRKVTRRWPIVLGGLIAVWLLAVVAYVAWPSPPPPPPPVIARKPQPPAKGPGDGPRPIDPLPQPKNPVVAPVDPPTTATTPTSDTPIAVGPEQPPPDAPNVPDAPPEGDSPEQPVEEDQNAALDDVRIGEFKRAKRIDERLDQIGASIRGKGQERLRKMFSERLEDAKKACDAATTLRTLGVCADEVELLVRDFNDYLLK
jgi:serine/threonine-protein kinase